MFSNAYDQYTKDLNNSKVLVTEFLTDEKIRDLNLSIIFVFEAYIALDNYSLDAQYNYNYSI